MAVQVEDRIADELARAVEGRLAAAVGLDDLDVRSVGDVELVRLFGAPAERDHVRVLEEEDGVGARAVADLRRDPPLQVPRLEVRRPAEAEEVRRPRHRCSVAPRVVRIGPRRLRPSWRTTPASRTGSSTSSWDQTNIQHAFRLDLLDADGQGIPGTEGETVHVEGAFEAGRPAGLKPGTPLDIPFVVPFGPLELAPGRYEVRLSIDGESREGWSAAFTVVTSPPQA